jgi:hypothetical protein
MRARLAALALPALLTACSTGGRLVVRRGPVDLTPLPVAGEALSPSAQALAAPAPLPPAASATLRVGKGDSLWTLARRRWGRGSRWPALARANGLSRPWVLQPGQRLTLPQGPLAAPAGPADQARRYGWPRQPNAAFTVGEKLSFVVQYGGVTAGYASLEIPQVEEREGRPCFRIEAHARTIPLFEAIFTVEDWVVSSIDVDHAFSWHYEKHIHEGGFRADASYVYDQRAHRLLEPAKGKAMDAPALTQDVLSCFYYFRTLALKPGDRVLIPVTADDWKSYQLSVDVLRRERVSTLAGTFDCLVVVPHMAFKGVFQQTGEVTLWVTDDARHIPVLIKSKIFIGSININLKDAEWVEPAPRP